MLSRKSCAIFAPASSAGPASSAMTPKAIFGDSTGAKARISASSRSSARPRCRFSARWRSPPPARGGRCRAARSPRPASRGSSSPRRRARRACHVRPCGGAAGGDVAEDRAAARRSFGGGEHAAVGHHRREHRHVQRVDRLVLRGRWRGTRSRSRCRTAAHSFTERRLHVRRGSTWPSKPAAFMNPRSRSRPRRRPTSAKNTLQETASASSIEFSVPCPGAASRRSGGRRSAAPPCRCTGTSTSRRRHFVSALSPVSTLMTEPGSYWRSRAMFASRALLAMARISFVRGSMATIEPR
jgi:hypothetical protein